MTVSTDDSLPGCLLQKLASYQRGPREAVLLREPSRNDWVQIVLEPVPFDESTWLADPSKNALDYVSSVQGSDERRCDAASEPHSSCVISKYMPAFYRHAVQDDGSPGKGDVDKAKVLEQQTMQMQMEWRQQEAAAKSYADRKVKPGVPFARPGPAHPKFVGAAGMVPNNMLKHKWKESREPDLTKDPCEPHAATHAPFQNMNSVVEKEGVKRGQPVARLHCKAFQFPLLPDPQHKNSRPRKTSPVRLARHPQMLGSGFRIRRVQLAYNEE